MAAELTHRNRFRWLLSSLLACLSLVVCWPPLSLSSTPPDSPKGSVRQVFVVRQGETLDELCSVQVPGDSTSTKLFLGKADSKIRDLLEHVGRSPRDADAWSNLAAAYLCRSEQSDPETVAATDLFPALWAANQAVSVGAVYPHVAGQFNLALALERLSLEGLAKEAWSVALAHPLPEPWRKWALVQKKKAGGVVRQAEAVRAARKGIGEALRRGERPSDLLLRDAPPSLRPEIHGALPYALRALAKSPASEYRISLLLDLTGRSGDTRAQEFTRDVLDHDRRLILAAGATQRARWLQGYSDLIAGREASRRHAFGTAEPLLRGAATQLRELGSSLALGADLEWLEALQQDLGPATAGPAAEERRRGDIGRLLQRIRGDAALVDHRWFQARFSWLEGLELAKHGDLSGGLKLLDKAYADFRDLGEVSDQAAVAGIRAEALRLLGRFRAAWQERGVALRDAAQGAAPPWLYNALAGAARDAHDEGWGSLGLRLNREALRVATSHGLAFQIPEAELLRASDLLADACTMKSSAALKGAKDAIERAREAMAKVGNDSSKLEPLQRDLERMEGELFDLQNPEAAFAAVQDQLDAGHLSDGAERPRLLARAVDLLLGPCRVSESGGRLAPRLPRALQLARLGMLEILRQTPGGASPVVERKAFLDLYRRTAQALTFLLVQTGETDEALAWILASFTTEATGSSPRSSGDVERLGDRLALQNREGLLVLQTAREEIYGWLVVGPHADAQFLRIDAKETQGLLARLRSAVGSSLDGEIAKATPAFEAARSDLSEALLGALRGNFSRLDRLTIVPSQDLQGIPFGALTNPDSGSFLAADLEIQVALPVGRAPGRPAARRPPGVSRRALFVGNPQNVDAAREGLPDLPYSALEAEEGARRFGSGALALTGPRAEKSTVLRTLPQVDLAHFGAHALRGAEGNGLLLASPGKSNAGFLQGDEIRALPLHLELVTLSACRSAEPGHPAAGVDGLVEAFLAAGSDTVIASLWNVDDKASSKLWGAFYEELLRGADPAAALHEAQVKILRQPNLANPAYWAGFAVYHGDLPMKGE